MSNTDTAALVRQMRDLLVDAKEDVQTELQRCRDLAGRPSTDRRLAAQETLAADVDATISAAEEWLAQQSSPPKTGNITEPYSVEEIRTKIASHDYSAELLLQHAMLHLERLRGPLTDEEVTAEAFTAHGYAQGTTGSAMFRRGVRHAERANGIGQPAGKDKQC